MNKKMYYLTGFMAAGKSTIGPILANTLGWNFYDLDREVESQEKMKVVEIFEAKGENYFRKAESGLLKKLSEKTEAIISLGGGAISSDENFRIIKSSGKIIYLKSSPEMAYQRLRFKRDRPSFIFEGEEVPSKEQFIERINKLLDERKKYYEQADYIIDTDNQTVGKTVDILAKYVMNQS
ncbi:MAG: shikimate kinase [Ignavibacteriota bacterium]|nr:MAG: shikimate kinase [Chlorobiota bacterium]MBE7476670.1 shikimate kinase [Ignavibacteriales bacterium]MBL1122078.1 shikimate kinase [Ignavibacteriota bacterium]GJQ43075.1 MAG: shikimate kinase [Ignavibacteriaceae bacterium]QKJ96634.1 MAG: shikimate kinase [Ignavibacteriota bacterium]